MLKVLVVDDDRATVEVITGSVAWEQLGVSQVEKAFHVREAKQIIAGFQPDIIISDIEMPGENGLDLLQWVRRREYRCEFLFLTCHENFTYASEAINYEAAAYITKPFDLDTMEMNLRKAAVKIRNSRNLEETSQYGEWMKSNIRYIQLDFWKQLLGGELKADPNWLHQEIVRRHLNIDSGGDYGLVYTRISGVDADLERVGKSIFEFVIEGFHSEILSQEVINDSVVRFSQGEVSHYVTVFPGERQSDMKQRCEQLLAACRKHFSCTVTCCISTAEPLTGLAERHRKLGALMNDYIGGTGTVYREEEVPDSDRSQTQILDLQKLVKMVEEHDKTGILRYMKIQFAQLTACKNLTTHSLYLMKQEIIQVVYADLAKQGIQATKLFYDEVSIKISDRAVDSAVDMMRWVNYLLDKTFQYEEEVERAHTFIDKVNAYIYEHYREDIGRSEIAEHFFLTPEYLAKLYKKKTGVTLKDAIQTYRIERARELLRAGQKTVSETAEAVGYDNYSYFSTLFKKYTGISPKEYRDLSK